MQIKILAIYLGFVFITKTYAKRLPKVVINNCTSCHSYLSSSREFESSRFITTSKGRETFVKSLDYMPPGKKLDINEQKEIKSWFLELADSRPLEKRRILTPKEAAYRCYQTFYNGIKVDAELLKIHQINNQKESFAYCKGIVKSISSNPIVIKNLYKYLNSSFPSYNLSFNNQDWGSFEVYDISQLAMSFVHSIISNKKIDSIFNGSLYQSIRNRVGPDEFLITKQYGKYFYPKENTSYYYGTFEKNKSKMPTLKHIEKGDLISVKKGLDNPLLEKRCFGNNLRTCEKTKDFLGRSLGAGVLGDPAYFLANNGLDIGEKPLGDEKNHRRWVNRIMSDYLCRTLPVISKVESRFIKKNSKLNFQRSKECMSCHVTLDGLAKVTHHYSVYYNNLYAEKVDLLDEEDKNNEIVLQFAYPSRHKEAISGKLHYESLTSEVKYSQAVVNLNGLAKFLLNESDFYYCQASRLIEYVSGEKIDILNLSKSEYRSTIEAFKKHRNLRQLLLNLVEHANSTKF